MELSFVSKSFTLVASRFSVRSIIDRYPWCDASAPAKSENRPLGHGITNRAVLETRPQGIVSPSNLATWRSAFVMMLQGIAVTGLRGGKDIATRWAAMLDATQ